MKAETKGDFQCFYMPVILIDSIYRKSKNYSPAVFIEKYYFYWRNRKL